MFYSITCKNVVLSILPNWEGNIDIYRNDIKKIELAVHITNNSKFHYSINKISLRIRKNILFLFYYYKDVPVEGGRQFVGYGSSINFFIDLKPILDNYGRKQKFRIQIKGNNRHLLTKSMCIKEIHDSIVQIYARNF